MGLVAEKVQRLHGVYKPAADARSEWARKRDQDRAEARQALAEVRTLEIEEDDEVQQGTPKPGLAFNGARRERAPTKRDWVIENLGKSRMVTAPLGLPYRHMERGDEVWIDAEAYANKRFKVRNHIQGAKFVRLDKTRDGKAFIVVRRAV
jgi:hypothetical protein